MTSIDVIIPTTCEHVRASLLARAIDSVLSQKDVGVQLLLIVNGTRFDPALLETLRGDTRLSVAYLPTPSAPLACQHGRSMVTSDYFAYLDDDDEYMPGALATRHASMTKDLSLDFVVTNGYLGSFSDLSIHNAAQIQRDPLSALLTRNWLASCGPLYRTASCGTEFFEALPSHVEWTMLAYRLLLAGKRMRFLDVPTYRIHDTPASLSKSSSYRLASVGVVEQLLSLPLPEENRRALHARLLAARHDLSDMYLQQRDYRRAWKFHLQSLNGLAGFRYLSYTRHLILPAVRRKSI